MVITWIYVSPNQHFRPPLDILGVPFPHPVFLQAKIMWDEFSFVNPSWTDSTRLGLINGLDNTFIPPILLCITLAVPWDGFFEAEFWCFFFFEGIFWIMDLTCFVSGTKMRWLILGSYFGFVSGTKMTFCWKVFIEFFPLWMDTFLQKFLIGNLGKMFSHRYESTITDGCRQKQAVPPK